MSSATPCNDSTGWVSGYPVQQGTTIVGFDTLFTGRDGPPARDERNATIQCTTQAGGPHGVGGNVLMGDGSVRLMTFGVDADFWRALLSIDCKEDIDLVAGRVLSE